MGVLVYSEQHVQSVPHYIHTFKTAQKRASAVVGQKGILSILLYNANKQTMQSCPDWNSENTVKTKQEGGKNEVEGLPNRAMVLGLKYKRHSYKKHTNIRPAAFYLLRGKIVEKNLYVFNSERKKMVWDDNGTSICISLLWQWVEYFW